jgi:hypothetical protein
VESFHPVNLKGTWRVWVDMGGKVVWRAYATTDEEFTGLEELYVL